MHERLLCRHAGSGPAGSHGEKNDPGPDQEGERDGPELETEGAMTNDLVKTELGIKVSP